MFSSCETRIRQLGQMVFHSLPMSRAHHAQWLIHQFLHQNDTKYHQYCQKRVYRLWQTAREIGAINFSLKKWFWGTCGGFSRVKCWGYLGENFGERVNFSQGKCEGNVSGNCPGCVSRSPCKITSLCVQLLWFVPPWLTYTHTHRQLLTNYTISSASRAKKYTD